MARVGTNHMEHFGVCDQNIVNFLNQKEIREHIIGNSAWMQKLKVNKNVIVDAHYDESEPLQQAQDGKEMDHDYQSTCIHIEYPYSIFSRTNPPAMVRAERLRQIPVTKPSKTECDIDNNKALIFEDCFKFDDETQKNKYEYWCQRELIKILLTNENIVNHFKNNSISKSGICKNLLLLDWDNTLWCHGTIRPHSIEFLQCATKFCAIFINTAGRGERHDYNILDYLNKQKGVYIAGIITKSRQKGWLNDWIAYYGWCNIDQKSLNFLLLDDIDQRCTNFVQVPRFSTSDYNYKEDDALLKLIPWLKQWHQYTTIEKRGTTNQFIRSHPIFYLKEERDQWRFVLAFALAVIIFIIFGVIVTQA